MSVITHQPFNRQERVAVLMGGQSSERAVSLMSGQGVLAALQARGVNAMAFDPAEHPLHELQALGVKRVFIALHGRGGEDGTVQGALEWLGIPYTGSGVMASALAMDKGMTKRVWTSHGLRNARSQLVSGAMDEARLDALCADLGLPLVVKPPHEGSSIGVTKVSRREDLPAALATAFELEPTALCESFIDGPELTCAVLETSAGIEALPVVRIEAPEAGYDYQNKYFTDDVRYHCPSGLPEALEQDVQRMAVAAFQALGCRGWGRADVMLTAQGVPHLLEMNTSPGMTSHSLVPMAARVAGLAYEDLCLHVLSMARLDRPANGGAA